MWLHISSSCLCLSRKGVKVLSGMFAGRLLTAGCHQQADLAALWHVVDALLRWRAAAAAAAAAAGDGAAQIIPATQTALLVEAGVTCNLQHVTQVGLRPRKVLLPPQRQQSS